MGVGATTVTYNEVVLTNVLTREFRTEAIYEEQQVIAWRTTFAVVGWVHLQHKVTTFISDLGAATVADQEDKIRKALLQPRKTLEFKVGENVMLSCLNSESFSGGKLEGLDVTNGPQPVHVDVTKIIGANALRVEFRCRCETLECDPDKNTKGVLINQFSITEDRDENHYITRTIDGRVRFTHPNINKGQFDRLAFPALEGGFRRDNIRTVKTRDGLWLEYSIRDKQVYVVPPPPATTFTCRHTERIVKGVKFFGEINCKMTTKPGGNKHEMICNAFRITENRLQLKVEKGQQPPYIILEMAVVDHIDSGTIETRVMVQHLPNNDGGSPGEGKDFVADFVKGVNEILGTPLSNSDGDSIPNYTNTAAVRPVAYPPGSASDSFVSFILQTPCDNRHALPKNPPTVRTNPRYGGCDQETNQGGGPAIVTPEVCTSLATCPINLKYPKFSKRGGKILYSHYQMETKETCRQMNVHAPVARTSKKGGRSSTIVRLAPKMGTKTVTIVAQSNGGAPTIPQAVPFSQPSSRGGRAVPIGECHIVSEPPQQQIGNNEKLQTLAVQIELGLDKAPEPDADISPGSLPEDDTTISLNLIAGRIVEVPGTGNGPI